VVVGRPAGLSNHTVVYDRVDGQNEMEPDLFRARRRGGRPCSRVRPQSRRWVPILLSVPMLFCMLTAVDTPGAWIREGRQRLGLSIRELAKLAKVAYPTIARIEHGQENPRWDTLQKIVTALGQDIDLSGQSASVVRLADLVDAWSKDRTGKDQPAWTRLRAFADQLTLRPEITAAAIAPSPMPSGSPFFDNLLAAVAEKFADDIGIKRPLWTRQWAPLGVTWESLGTPRMRAANVARTPIQFKERGIMIPESAIWRDRELVPA
jgi:transcriptional regulator with XRE-family HTH domain